MGQPWPEDLQNSSRCVSAFQAWSYSYMNPVFKRGAEFHRNSRKHRPLRFSLFNIVNTFSSSQPQHEREQNLGDTTTAQHQNQLTEVELYAAPVSLQASTIKAKFNDIFEQENGKLITTLWRLALPSFLHAGLCQFITVIAQTAVPLLVWRLLHILESNSSKNVFREAIPYVLFIFIFDVLNAFATNRHKFLAMKSGVTIRVALIVAIYERILHLTPEGKSGLTTGTVTSLFAIDTQKLFEVTAEGHVLWSAPLSMTLVAIMLMSIVGPSMATGIALLMSFAPIVQVISSKMLEIRNQRIKVTDNRVEIINSMLQGIKVTKLNNYESRYIERLQKVRDEEVRLLRKEMYVWSVVMAIQFISPVVASAGAFAAYVLSGNILTATDAFTALLLFNSLRFPINYASRLVGKVAQARESAHRISSFLQREMRESRSKIENELNIDASGTTISHLAITQHNDSHENKPGRVAIKSSDQSSSVIAIPSLSTGENLLVIKNGIFRIGDTSSINFWERSICGADEKGFTVRDINIALSAGQILAIVGPVGSGKSTIINAIIGEVEKSPNTVIETRGKVAYTSQMSFILNTSLRDNILFGSDYHAERYSEVLDACCLSADIDQLSAGDMTEIGERGVTLSGGQKQRVSIARAVYSNPDIILFDDPLSALDAGTSQKIFDRLFNQAGNNLLSKTAVVLVTHASHFLHRVNQIMIVVEGGVPFVGSWDELSNYGADDPKTKAVIESILNAVQQDRDKVEAVSKKIPILSNSSSNVLPFSEVESFREAVLNPGISDTLMSQEFREHGISSTWVWTLWFKEAGGYFFSFGVFTLFVLEKTFYFGTEWWMTRWTQAVSSSITFLEIEFAPQMNGLQAQLNFLAVYTIFALLGLIFAFLRTVWIVSGGITCSKRLYSTMTACVLHAPMIYFETTPLGRLLNRFTYDAEILDVTLVWSMSMLLISMSWFVTSLIVMIAILPWMILIMIPVSFCYWMIQLHYRKSGADLQRLDALSRSPLQTMLAEGIEGSATIRTFCKERSFTHRFQLCADKNTSAQMNFISAQRWLGVRTEFLGGIIVFIATLAVIIFNEFFGLSAGLVALLIRWSSGITVSLSFLVDNASEAEGAMTAIERIKHMSEIPQEQNFEKRLDFSLETWPVCGEVEFRNVQMRYRPRLPLALDGLSFRVDAGQHCGVVGRTGAGKSSLSVALFRLVELEAGTIIVDGVDISTLGLSDVRGRPNGLAIIPQDPFLFAGTLRECLDPFKTCRDEMLLNALLSVRMLGPDQGKEYLDSYVEEGGANFSVGERSLLVLARAMLAHPKLLLMDEATANIDRETDNFIQKMLRTRFAKTTLITIAHRLDTIMDYDVILVMSDGKVAQFGAPAVLLEQGGIFSELVHATGDGAASLIGIAKKAYSDKHQKLN